MTHMKTTRQELIETAARRVRMWNRDHGLSAFASQTAELIGELVDDEGLAVSQYNWGRFVADVNKENAAWL